MKYLLINLLFNCYNLFFGVFGGILGSVWGCFAGMFVAFWRDLGGRLRGVGGRPWEVGRK